MVFVRDCWIGEGLGGGGSVEHPSTEHAHYMVYVRTSPRVCVCVNLSVLQMVMCSCVCVCVCLALAQDGSSRFVCSCGVSLLFVRLLLELAVLAVVYSTNDFFSSACVCVFCIVVFLTGLVK